VYVTHVSLSLAVSIDADLRKMLRGSSTLSTEGVIIYVPRGRVWAGSLPPLQHISRSVAASWVPPVGFGSGFLFLWQNKMHSRTHKCVKEAIMCMSCLLSLISVFGCELLELRGLMSSSVEILGNWASWGHTKSAPIAISGICLLSLQ